MNTRMSDGAMLAGRVLMALLFLQARIGQVMGPARIIANIAKSGLPLPEVSYAVSVVVLLGAGLGVLLGVKFRWAALALAAYCLFTAWVFHYAPGDGGQMSHFYKDVALAGGLLCMALNDAGAFSLDAMLGARRSALG